MDSSDAITTLVDQIEALIEASDASYEDKTIAVTFAAARMVVARMMDPKRAIEGYANLIRMAAGAEPQPPSSMN